MMSSWLFPSPHTKNKPPTNPFRTPQVVPDEDYLLSHPVFQLVYCAAVGSLLVAIVWCVLYPSTHPTLVQQRPHFAPQLRGRRLAPLFRTPLVQATQETQFVAAATPTNPVVARTWNEEGEETDDAVLRDTKQRLYYEQQADDVYDEFGMFAAKTGQLADSDDEVQVVQRQQHHHRHHQEVLPSTVDSILPIGDDGAGDLVDERE